MDRVKDEANRLWYMEQTLANGWSRNILLLMVKSEAHWRQGKAITNFERLLFTPQSHLVASRCQAWFVVFDRPRALRDEIRASIPSI